MESRFSGIDSRDVRPLCLYFSMAGHTVKADNICTFLHNEGDEGHLRVHDLFCNGMTQAGSETAVSSVCNPIPACFGVAKQSFFSTSFAPKLG